MRLIWPTVFAKHAKPVVRPSSSNPAGEVSSICQLAPVLDMVQCSGALLFTVQQFNVVQCSYTVVKVYTMYSAVWYNGSRLLSEV